MLVNAAATRVDPTAGELYHILLELWREASPQGASVTNSVSFNQIKDTVRRTEMISPGLIEHFDQYLRVLCKFKLRHLYKLSLVKQDLKHETDEDSSSLVSKIGDAGGGQFVLNYGAVFEKLACATLDSIVLERFGSKALRLFRWAVYQQKKTHHYLKSFAVF